MTEKTVGILYINIFVLLLTCNKKQQQYNAQSFHCCNFLQMFKVDELLRTHSVLCGHIYKNNMKCKQLLIITACYTLEEREI